MSSDAPRLRLVYLDGLRALAASYVVGFHAVVGFAGPDLRGAWRALNRLFAFGHEAVAVFIVLSGYCLMLPVVRHTPDELTVDMKRFVRRRAFRILPPYYAALALSLLALALIPALRTPDSGTLWDDSLPGLATQPITLHLLLLHNWSPSSGYQINGPLWSVASEWQIYFFFPLLLLPLWRRWGAGAAVLAATLLGFAPLLLVNAAAHVAIPWYLLLFTLGMLAAAICFSPRQPYVRLRTHVRWQPLAGGAWLVCFVLGLGFASFWFAHKPLADLFMGCATATLLVALTARAASSQPGEQGLLLRVLESRPVVMLGHFSYSLYLTHLPVLALLYFSLRPLDLPAPVLTLALLTLGSLASLVVAYVFYWLVERHFIVSSPR